MSLAIGEMAFGDVMAFTGIVRDITLRRQTEQALLEAKDEADRANLAKSEFLSRMSHELRTPMNAILGFAQMLEFDPAEPLSKRQRRSVDHILQGGQHLLELINEVLDLARVEAGKVTLSPEAVDPREAVRECLSLTESLATKHEVKVSTGGVGRSLKKAWVDPMLLRQILLNLLSNAIKYNVPGGKVSVTCREMPDGMIRIDVADAGLGIPEEMQGQLFQPFSRLGDRHPEIEGTGIGLTITKQLVELMNGRISLESEVGKGSTFRVEFPLATKEPDADGAVPAATPLEPREAVKLPRLDGSILYVEDNPANLLLMEAIIERVEGLDLITARNAELGLELAESRRPVAIIMDIGLPGMNGFEALKLLRLNDKTRDIPVIALSADAMAGHVKKGLDAGFLAYLTKPFNIGEVVDAIEEAMNRGREVTRPTG